LEAPPARPQFLFAISESDRRDADAAAVGFVVGWPRAGTGGEVARQLTSWSDSLVATSAALSDPMAQIALAVAALSLLAVFWRSDRLAG
jgi:hypothetical protein